MAALSDHSENLLLNYLMTGGSVTRPSNHYLALFTAAPNDAGGGTECSGNGYARKQTHFATATGTGGTTSNDGTTAANGTAVSFTASGGSFGTVTHIGVFDAVTTGNMLWHGTISTQKTVADGDTLQFISGAVDLTIA
jgi:hypothetical protein